MAYIGSSPTKVVSRQSANIFTYTATANQTAFTGADANGNTLACSPSDIMVHMNGIKLEESDYTATTTTVTLGSGAAAGDEVTITAFVTFESADHYNKSTSDTRYVNASGDTMSGDLTIDTKLGIGTVSPNYQLDLQGGATTNDRLRLLRGTDDTNQFMTLGWNHISTHRANVALASAQTGLSFKQVGSDGTRTAMAYDSAGRVTMPNQPAFFAWNSTTFTGTGIVPFNNTTYNQGNHFNTSTGRFTAPVAGVYLFTVICTSGSNQSATYQFLGLNGNRHRDLFEGDSFSTNSERNASAHLKLSANDVVDFRNGGVIAVQGSGNGNYYSAFMGVLLG